MSQLGVLLQGPHGPSTTSVGVWNWLQDAPLARWACRVTGVEGVLLARITRAYYRGLDGLEKHPVIFTTGGALSSSQPAPFLDSLQNAEMLQQALAKVRSGKVQRELRRLAYRVDALRYRLEMPPEEAAKAQQTDMLQRCADTWKASKICFNATGRAKSDERWLERIAPYGHFVQNLLEDGELREQFFGWTFRDCNDPTTFLQYPNLQRELTRCGLAKRIGVCGVEALRIQKVAVGEGGDVEKVVTLPFEGRDINILDPEKVVTFRGDYQLSMEKIFHVFRDRHLVIGNLEYFQKLGICNWNPKRFGWYNAKTGKHESIDFDKENWWEDLPVYRVISAGEAAAKFQVPCDGSQWVVSLRASREKPNLQPTGTHAYLEVATPCAEGYRLFSFGKFTEVCPETWYQTLTTMAGTVAAVVSCPDENIFYTDRQHAGVAALQTSEEGAAFMASIKRNIIDSRRGNFFFQFLSENCCKWAWKKARTHLGEKVIQDFFGLPFPEIRPVGAMGLWMDFLRALPYRARCAFLGALSLALGGWRGTTVIKKDGKTRRWISLQSTPPWKRENVLYHPAQDAFFEKV